MKKELWIITVIFVLLLSTAITLSEEKDASNDEADSPSFWSKVIDFFTKPKYNPITGHAVEEEIQKTRSAVEKTTTAVKSTGSRIKETVKEATNIRDCKAVICYKDDEEIFCPDSEANCESQYDDCRTVWCYSEPKPAPTASPDEKEDPATYEYVPPEDVLDSYDLENEQCVEQYNDCTTDAGEDIVCHGDYEDCCNAFARCSCGTGGSKPSDLLDFQEDAAADAAERGDCLSDEYLCKKVGIAMSGDPIESTVECKASYPECAARYGECRCANLTTSWFDDLEIGDVASSQWCDWEGKQVLCSMLPENCDKKKNTCDKGNGVFITCDGSLDFCNEKYDGRCLCGLSFTEDFIRD
ncbi:TPA: hypothetical protein HA265_01080 [Candidatus Woesearchaeota archaeon]|nr:hypothetical protein [Candidatus Woesearchaeota archaeon]